MHPVLFEVPFLNQPLHTYGAMIVIGFLLALEVSKWRARTYGKYEMDAADFGFWALLGGLIGARVVFIAVEWQDYFVLNPWTKVEMLGIYVPSFLAIWKGGLVYWGGFLGGFVSCLFFVRARRLPALLFLDMMVIGVPLAQAFGRLGCVAAGCCYGHALGFEHAVGMHFPPGSAAFDNLINTVSPEVKAYMVQHASTWPLFPSQLAESFGALGIFFVLLWLSGRKQFHGQVLLAYAVLYSVMRSILEVFRGDIERGSVLGGTLSTSQFISVCVIVVAVLASQYYRHKNHLLRSL